MSDPEDDNDCGSCQGTGIGWGGPDSSCSVCRGRGYSVRKYEPDEPDDDSFYDESY